MPNDKIKNYLHLHLIVFIWGFTAVLGKLISLQALHLVWFRMVFALTFLLLYVAFTKTSLRIAKKMFLQLTFSGAIIALHWLTFYQAIKVSNISITLACLSTGAFFASLLEPIFFKRKIILYEVVLGIAVIIGLSIIFKVEIRYVSGIILALISAFLSALFSMISAKFAQHNEPVMASTYYIVGGVFFLTIFMAFYGSFTKQFFAISSTDFYWLLILSSICTAYAFSASVKIMKFLSPYTVMLTINLEPIYGIVLALLVFEKSEHMNKYFYIGALIILSTVVLNGILKNRKK